MPLLLPPGGVQRHDGVRRPVGRPIRPGLELQGRGHLFRRLCGRGESFSRLVEVLGFVGRPSAPLRVSLLVPCVAVSLCAGTCLWTRCCTSCLSLPVHLWDPVRGERCLRFSSCGGCVTLPVSLPRSACVSVGSIVFAGEARFL